MQKLEILIKLTNSHNVESVLAEFKEYAQEVDIEFVRKSVRAIGRVAVKLEKSAGRCVTVLSELVKMRVGYVVQECVIVIKDIFRRYPRKYEKIIIDLTENLESLDEPEAKASMIWIIGEYADRIVDAEERLEHFVMVCLFVCISLFFVFGFFTFYLHVFVFFVFSLLMKSQVWFNYNY